MEWETINGVEWIKDDRGNKCSVDYFGTREAAEVALKSLKNCDDCENCSDCSRCSGCSDCSRCSDCSDCSGCSGCSGCSDCSRCSHIAWLRDKKNLKGDPDSKFNGAPPVPTIEGIHQKVYDAASKPGALNMNTWHTCETTHCRAGWVVALAGDAGRLLEEFHDTPLAASLIYQASSPHKVTMPRFYEPGTVAMDDMRRMAELEASDLATA